ncbi:unnamed protein product [Prorocentrum cordatum]|uniref:Phosphoglycerate kinase n=1 Tax=Prorocentrum cordatum TaxID=2364126 RepID=A0ABN9S5H7_9DINO|nr:unnamed protein product [Polarella glacialis]
MITGTIGSCSSSWGPRVGSLLPRTSICTMRSWRRPSTFGKSGHAAVSGSGHRDSDFCAVDWKLFKLTGFARSSLHGESRAAAAGMDALEFAKRFRAPLIYDNVNVNVDEGTRYAGESALAIDAKAPDDAAKKESTTSFQDRRTGIEDLALRERMDATQAQWE